MAKIDMANKIDVVGKKYGRLFVKSDAASVSGRRRVLCVCDCGHEKTYDPRLLISGKTSSCGCFHRDRVSASSSARVTHGMTKSKEYNCWQHMKARCYRKSNHKYPEYGGRGIYVCDRWIDSFELFIFDMGKIPYGCNSVDRIDPDGPYSPENCRWANPKIQSRNKRNNRLVELDGKAIPLSEACEKMNINYRSALWRINNKKPWMPLPKPPM